MIEKVPNQNVEKYNFLKRCENVTKNTFQYQLITSADLQKTIV